MAPGAMLPFLGGKHLRALRKAFKKADGAISKTDEAAQAIDNAKKKAQDTSRCEISEVPTPKYPVPSVPENPTIAPGPDWAWRGKPGEAVGGDKGAWFNPKTGETMHPDLGHSGAIGPHWDWRDPDGNFWRIFPDGRIELRG